MKRYIKSATSIYATSMSKIYQYINTRNVATLTAFITSDDPERPTKKKAQTRDQNHKDNQALAKDIRKYGFGCIKVNGYWDETKSGDPKNAVREVSFLVVCTPTTPYEEFEATVLKLAKEYEQQAVAVWNYQDRTTILWGTTDYRNYSVWEKMTNFNIDTVLGEAWSQYRSHAIVFSSTDWDYYLDSVSEFTVGAEGPTSCRAAKYHRDQFLNNKT